MSELSVTGTLASAKEPVVTDIAPAQEPVAENSAPAKEKSSKDSALSEKPIATDKEADEGRSRAAKKDRSGGKYSEEAFLALPRSEQLALAERYWNGPVATFDDGTFQFSYTHFGKICEQIGFRKGIVDTRPEIKLPDKEETEPSAIIYIDHGRREETIVKKLTLSKETEEKISRLLGDRLSNIEKSKVVDVILSQALDRCLVEQKAGLFGVAYRPTEEERLI